MSLTDRKTTNIVKNQKQDLRLLLHLAPFIKPYKKVTSIAGIALILSSIAILLLGQGRTTLIIAHRLATIMHADRILLIDQGRLIAQGSHHDLLASSELYKRLCELQFNH